MLGADPEAPVHHSIGGLQDQGVRNRGDVHLDHRQRRRIPTGTLHPSFVPFEFLVLASHVDQASVLFGRFGLPPPGVIASHLSPASLREHAAFGVDLLQEILGFDQRVIASQPFDLGAHVLSVGRVLFRHLWPGHVENPLDPVFSFLFLQRPGGFRQERFRGPYGAPKHGGDVGGGAHRSEVFVPLIWAHVLGLVAFQQDAGGGAHNVSRRRRREERDSGAAVAKDVAVLGRRAAIPGVAHAFLQAHLGGYQLGLAGGCGFDDEPTTALKQVEQIRFHLRRGLVLARLARHHHHEGVPASLQDRVHDGTGGPQLVVVQWASNHQTREPANVRQPLLGH